jgi:membrane protein required for colicin V production
MNSFDLAILVIVLLFAAIGALRGLTREALSLLGWFAAGMAAWLFGADAGAYFTERVQDETARNILGFVVLFFGVFVATAIASLLLRKLVFAANLDTVDRVLGGLLGAVRGLAIVVIVVTLAGLTPFPRESWWLESQFAPMLESLAVRALEFVPVEVARQFSYR